MTVTPIKYQAARGRVFFNAANEGAEELNRDLEHLVGPLSVKEATLYRTAFMAGAEWREMCDMEELIRLELRSTEDATKGGDA